MANDVNDSVWSTEPRLLASLLCEDAAVSAAMNDRRASLQRIFYDVYADGFPAGFDHLNVATVWMGGAGACPIGARLSDPDGTILAEVETDYVAHPEPATAVHLFHFSSDGVMTMALPRPGRYSIDVLVDGVPVHTFPLFVIDGRADREVETDE